MEKIRNYQTQLTVSIMEKLKEITREGESKTALEKAVETTIETVPQLKSLLRTTRDHIERSKGAGYVELMTRIDTALKEEGK